MRTLWIAVSLGVLAACGTPGDVKESPIAALVEREDVFTQVNLRPRRTASYYANQPMRGSLSTLNLLGDDVVPEEWLPAGTPVVIERLSTRSLTFRVVGTEDVYKYTYKAYGTEPFAAHLERVFATEDPGPRIARMTERDREGIEQGTVLNGMTRAGVRCALGPPPAHKNPSPETADRWTYYKTSVDRLAVYFGPDGRVVRVRD